MVSLQVEDGALSHQILSCISWGLTSEKLNASSLTSGCLNLDWGNSSGPWESLQARGAWNESCQLLLECSAATAGELRGEQKDFGQETILSTTHGKSDALLTGTLSALLCVPVAQTMKVYPSPNTPLCYKSPSLYLSFDSAQRSSTTAHLFKEIRRGCPPSPLLPLRPHTLPMAFCFSSIPMGRTY